MIFVQSLMSALQRLLAKVPRGIRYQIISYCGLIALATPLALWLSMTLWGMRLILAVFFTAILLISLMVWSSPDDRI